MRSSSLASCRVQVTIFSSQRQELRLEAELAGKKEITFPTVTPGSSDFELSAAVFAQEKVLFDARAKELDRQTKSLSELRDY